MNIINFTVEFEEREKKTSYYLDGPHVEYTWYGVMKMNNIPIFETIINYIYDDEQQMEEQVIERFAQHIAPPREVILK